MFKIHSYLNAIANLVPIMPVSCYSLRTCTLAAGPLMLMLTLTGCQTYPSLPPVPEADTEHLNLRALGHEPPWQLQLNGHSLQLSQGYESLTDRLTIQQRTFQQGVYLMTADGLTLRVFNQTCYDSMTGMPYPYQVHLHLAPHLAKQNTNTYQGCGGEPHTLLTGKWLLTHLDGQPLDQEQPLSLQLSATGQVNGFSGCNRFTGQYQLTGEYLHFNPVASTRMACHPEVMALEQQLYTQLEAVRLFYFDAQQRLHLMNAQGDHLLIGEDVGH